MYKTYLAQEWECRVERSLDGYPLRVYGRPEGEQQPLLALIHGMAESWAIWPEVARGLEHSYSSVCLDLPWHGGGGYGWIYRRSAAEWLHETLRLLPHHPAVLVAHSFGANTVLDYLQRFEAPGLQAVVLISPFYCHRYEDLTWELYEQAFWNFRAVMRLGLQLRQRPGRRPSPAILEAMLEKVIEAIGPLGFAEFFNLFSRTPVLNTAAIQAPVLVTGGADDPGISPANAAALAAALPTGRLALIPNCSHFSMLERPAMLAKLISSFLADASAAVSQPPEDTAHSRSVEIQQVTTEEQHSWRTRQSNR